MNEAASRWAILAALSLIRLSFGYQFQSMAALAPQVSADLGLDQAQMGTLIGLYWAPGVLVALPGGWLGRRFGDKRMVLVGGGLTVLGGLVCALASSYGMLAAGRLVAGLGGIVMNVLAVKVAADWFAGREIGFAMGALFGSFPLGIALGLATQAPLAGAFGWPAVMASTAVLGAVVVAAIALVVHSAPAIAAPLPAPDAKLLTPHDVVLVSAAGLGLALYNGAFLVYVSYAPRLLTAEGLGVAAAGVILAVANALSTVFLPLGGHLADRSGRPLATLFLATIVFCVCVAALPAVAASGWLAPIAALALLLSMVGALPVSPMVALPAEALPPQRRALGLGLFYTWFYLGATLCPALGGWVYGYAGSPSAPIYLVVALSVAALGLYGVFSLLQKREGHPKVPL
jgi:predicted MFS family arabinose efflux permease